ncbi:unnamed protein product, partial [Heterosigma akashiwo]
FQRTLCFNLASKDFVAGPKTTPQSFPSLPDAGARFPSSCSRSCFLAESTGRSRADHLQSKSKVSACKRKRKVSASTSGAVPNDLLYGSAGALF